MFTHKFILHRLTGSTFDKMFHFVVAASLILAVSAQIPSFGKCPNVTLKATLSIPQYLGDWYEIEKFFAIFQVGQECTKATYTLKDDGHVNVFNRGIYTKDRTENNATGDAYVIDPINAPSKLGVRFSEFQPYGNYWVVDTDYNTYSLVYSCSQLLGKFVHTEFAWILSRTPTLDQNVVDRLKKLIGSQGVDVSHFNPTNQKGCPAL